MTAQGPVWDGVLGTAGGPLFGSRVQALAREREVTDEALAGACGISLPDLQEVFLGTGRIGISALARMMRAVRSHPIEFMQATGMLSQEVYAGGLDPLYFLPPDSIRYEARIYMREINPRHPVPEGDMTKRNPTLAAVMNDSLLDELGKAELELAYLLRAAVQHTGGSL